MLPLIILQTSENTHVDTDLNTAPLLPADVTELNGSFENLLQLELDTAPNPEIDGGQGLPESGESLPPGLQGESDLPAEALLLNETEVLSDEILTVSSLALPLTEPESEFAPVTEMPPQETVSPRLSTGALGHADARSQTALTGSQVAALESATLKLGAGDPNLQPLRPVDAGPGNPSDRVPIADLRSENIDGQSLRPVLPVEAVVAPLRLPGQQMPDLRATSSNAPQVAMPPIASTTETALPGIADVPIQDALPQVTQILSNHQAPLAPIQVPNLQATAAQPAASTIVLNMQVQDANWGDRLSDRVLFMAGNKLQNAEIRLTPAELGPLRVRITVEDGVTNVNFHAQYGVTREAIEQALPRLREMLTENGLTLGQASVGEQGAQHGHREANRGTTVVPGASVADTDSEAEAKPQRQMSGRLDVLLDTFV